MKTSSLTTEEQVVLETFPEDDKYYSLEFVVPKDWLIDILERLDALNNCEGVDLQRFLDNYIWDETYFLHAAAEEDGVIISQQNKQKEENYVKQNS